MWAYAHIIVHICISSKRKLSYLQITQERAIFAQLNTNTHTSAQTLTGACACPYFLIWFSLDREHEGRWKVSKSSPLLGDTTELCTCIAYRDNKYQQCKWRKLFLLAVGPAKSRRFRWWILDNNRRETRCRNMRFFFFFAWKNYYSEKWQNCKKIVLGL